MILNKEQEEAVEKIYDMARNYINIANELNVMAEEIKREAYGKDLALLTLAKCAHIRDLVMSCGYSSSDVDNILYESIKPLTK